MIPPLAAAAELLGLSQAALALGFFVFLRVGAVMALLPAFGEQVVPLRVRLVLSLALTLLVAPGLSDLPRLGPGADWPRLMVTEPLAGIALGAVLRLLVMVLQIAGVMAAQATSLSQIFGTQAAEPLPAMGHMLTMAGLCALVMTGLHVRAVELLLLSYELLPPGLFPDAGELLEWGVARVGHAFGLAFSLAAPFVIASMLYNLTLGIINRAMPQLMVAFVGAPAITAGGLILMALSLPGMIGVWMRSVDAVLANPFTVTP
ncbi:type III secretion protein [Mesobaculum littorinae]|uniref:Type III secretion protein n=1 Tax=Mesobaculum littorinae TaxID=2486419 RepID=A0A438AH98_9RHOB|nr:flagellar biosynthetic protein FliR [Mesobaculum littorinae]RVV97967.1 type III secretion protein [Mesobaculum littorinae]